MRFDIQSATMIAWRVRVTSLPVRLAESNPQESKYSRYPDLMERSMGCFRPVGLSPHSKGRYLTISQLNFPSLQYNPNETYKRAPLSPSPSNHCFLSKNSMHPEGNTPLQSSGVRSSWLVGFFGISSFAESATGGGSTGDDF
jgi:hypothetical protein